MENTVEIREFHLGTDCISSISPTKGPNGDTVYALVGWAVNAGFL